MILTATIQIGQSRSALRILDPDRRARANLNLIWGYGGGDTPEERANTLLVQNGYRLTGPWRDTREGPTATVEAGGETSACSCWLRQVDGEWVAERRVYGCDEHPEASR